MDQIEIEQLVNRQKDFFRTGRTKNVDFRKRALIRLKRTIVKYQGDIAAALFADLHKSSFEAYLTETGMSVSELSYAIKHIDRWTAVKYVPTPLSNFLSTSFTVQEPYGEVLIMSPWNYPFLLTISPLIGAIAAGNCVILKPSAYSPNVSKVISRIISECFSDRYIAVVNGGRAENNSLLDQKFDYIFFTGSVAVGKMVMEKASANLTPVTLELGGKSPCIVDRTADLKIAARRLVFGKYLNGGQTCVAPDYLLIDSAIKDHFLELCKKNIIKMYGRRPLENPDYNRIVNKKHFDRIKGLMKDQTIYYGGNSDEESLMIEPTILDNVTGNDPVMNEEIFGPILPVITFNKLDEVENFICNRPKPLACYIFTRDTRVEKRLLSSLSFGGGCINDTIIHLATDYMPFGGVGDSGMGSYHGKKSFETFSHEKSIVKKFNHPDLPMRYQPYARKTTKIVKMFLK